MLSQYESQVKKYATFSLLALPFLPVLFLCALSGGRVRCCTSLEMRYTCLTKVICKQKKKPNWEHAALLWHCSACVCHKHAPLPSKSIFKELFRRPANILFSSGNVQNNLVLPSLFLWFVCWIINDLSTLPHQAHYSCVSCELQVENSSSNHSPPLFIKLSTDRQ